MGTPQGLGWDDPRLRKPSVDTAWATGCRALQAWWRQEVLGLVEYGPRSKPKPDGPEPNGDLVGSMLPLEAPAVSNFLDPVVLDEVERRLRQKGWGGLVSEDRLRRNMLSSQPVAFNVFGYLAHHPRALLAWLESLGIHAIEAEVRIEWAPPRDRHFGGGSAFDAAIFYESAGGGRGLVAVEVKYAENLDAQSIDPRPTYLDATRANGHWRPGASERLVEPRLAQLWLNALLAQSSVAHGEEGITEALVVAMACAADTKALRATADVRTELVDPTTTLAWCPFETVLTATASDPTTIEWATAFRRRYLDFTPVYSVLAPDDPRRSANPVASTATNAHRDLAAAYRDARAVADRVLGDGSVLEHVAGSTSLPPAASSLMLANRLREAAEALRVLRIAAGPDLDVQDPIAADPPSSESVGELVAAHCVAVLGEPQEWRPAPGYRSLALCAMDAIWSMGIRYEAVVVPLLGRYRTHRAAGGADAAVDSLQDLINAIEAADGPEAFARDVVVNWNRTSSTSGILKAEAVHQVATRLVDLGISTVDDLGDGEPSVLAEAERRWRRVRGQRSGISWDYFLMLTGREGVKSDRMVRRFVATALGHGSDESTVSPAAAETAVRDALSVLQADHPTLTLRALDRTIWGYQSRSGAQR